MQCNTSSTLNGGGNYGGTIQFGFSTSMSAGVTYTMTYSARSLSGNMSMRVSMQSGSGDENNMSHDSALTANWTKYTRTVTLDLVKPNLYFYNKSVGAGGIPGGIFQIADVQIEAKSYATNFTTGVRGTAYDFGFNFHTTLAYVTDPTNTVWVGSGSTQTENRYPSSKYAGSYYITAGWPSGLGLTVRDRSTTIDARLAGLVGNNNLGSAVIFRVDLPESGTWQIYLAAGDESFGNCAYFDILDSDGVTALYSVPQTATMSPGQYYDAMGTLHASAAAWVTNNQPRSLTFSGKIAYLRLNDSVGVIDSVFNHIRFYKSARNGLLDLTNNSVNGNLINGPIYNSAGAGCLVFDGIDDYVDLGNSIQLSNNFTLSVWVKDGSLSGTFILDQGDLGTDVNNRLEWVNCGLTLSSNNTNSVSASGTINTAVWNNVVVTFAGGVTKFYINGVLDTTTTFIIPTVTSFTPGGSILKIGRRAFNTTAIFSGKIAAIKIYSSTVLTATEVQQNYYALKGRFGL
jgi:hypothetical protein